MANKREFHPVANLFPLLKGIKFAELAADIQKNGLREPILIDGDGRILDGRNRYRACLKAGVEPRFVEWREDGNPADLALSLNLHRRHLSESERAMVGARLAKLLEIGRKSGANLHRGRSYENAAEQVNVSPRLVSSALKVMDHGDPSLIAAVESGKLAVSAAARQISSPRTKAPAKRRFGVVHIPDTAILVWVTGADRAVIVEALEAAGFERAEPPELLAV